MRAFAFRWPVLLGSAGILVASVLGGTSASYGQATTSLHDIPWYEAHPAVRKKTMEVCQSDHRFAHDVDCANAETADTKAWGRRSAKYAFSDLDDPRYWASQPPWVRSGVLASCRTPPTIYQPSVCAAAQQAGALARGPAR